MSYINSLEKEERRFPLNSFPWGFLSVQGFGSPGRASLLGIHVHNIAWIYTNVAIGSMWWLGKRQLTHIQLWEFSMTYLQ